MEHFSFEYKNDSVWLEDGLCYIYDAAHPLAFKALQVMLAKNSMFRLAAVVVPEPDERGVMRNTVSRADLLKIVWHLASVLKERLSGLTLEELRAVVVARYYTKYCADPLWYKHSI